MSSILDVYLDRQFHVPANPREYLALQIARKLGALLRTREYAVLLEHFPERAVVGAFRRARVRSLLSHDGFLAAFREVTAPAEEDTFYE